MERIDFDQWKGKEVARLLALVEAQRRYYQDIVADLPVALVVLAADRSVVSANRAFRQLFGVSAEELRRKSMEQILPSDVLIEKIRDVAVNGIPQPGFLLERGDKVLRISVLPLRNRDDERETETLLMLADVPAATPVAARAPVPDFPAASIPAALWRADASTLTFHQVSGAPESLLGYTVEQWLASTFFAQRIHPEDREAVLSHYRTALAGGTEASAEFRALSAAGDTVWCRETVRLSGPGTLSGITSRIGARRELEAQRITAERSSALRGLSADLAHALNNPLMIITGYAEELLHGLEPGDERRADIEQILEATQRIAGVTDRLLQFTRKQAKAPRSVDLAAVLADLKGEGATLDAPARPLWAAGDPGQLTEILPALIAAVRADAGGRATLHLDTIPVAELAPESPLQPGAYARITIRGEAPQAAAEKRGAAFESIIASDPRSAALARAYAVVREWGGDIALQSEAARGTGFLLYLPLAAEASSGRSSPPAPVAASQPGLQPQPANPARPRETVLVVDDEPGIRTLVAKILRREGYLVLEAGSAGEALTAAAAHGTPIQMLLTDVMLPDRTGRQLAEQFRETVAGVKILYISGFTGDETVRSGEFPPGSRFLQKPFTLSALVGTVRRALDA